MSKVAPHNAVIDVRTDEKGRKYVYKKYYATYTSEQEFTAYKNVSRCIAQPGSGIRMAAVYEVNIADNSLNIEFINYRNLHEIVVSGNVEILLVIKDRLLGLFSDARTKGIDFDSDPSNILCDEEGIDIVLIDPICTDLNLSDFSAVVFIWGLIKLSLRNPRVWKSIQVLKICGGFYDAYLLQSDVNFKDLNAQIGAYIGRAISWNSRGNRVEGFSVRLFRLVVVVPIYSLIRLLFVTNVVRSKI